MSSGNTGVSFLTVGNINTAYGVLGLDNAGNGRVRIISRQGNTALRASAVLLTGEIFYDTDLNMSFVGDTDGTSGGIYVSGLIDADASFSVNNRYTPWFSKNRANGNDSYTILQFGNDQGESFAGTPFGLTYTAPTGSSNPLITLDDLLGGFAVDFKINGILICGGIAQPVVYLTPTTGQTINVGARTVLEPAGTLSALTMNFVAFGTPPNGTPCTLSTTQAITTLTLSGGTFVGAPTTLTANSFFTMIYVTSKTKWYRQG